jgi:hypothetical protein
LATLADKYGQLSDDILEYVETGRNRNPLNRINHWTINSNRLRTSGADGATNTLQGQNQRLVTIINIYQVVEKFSQVKGHTQHMPNNGICSSDKGKHTLTHDKHLSEIYDSTSAK